MGDVRANSSNGSRRPHTGGNKNPRPNSRGILKPINKDAGKKIVGQYMLGKTIGEGTFGKVKIAVHIPTGENVAIKILEKNRIVQPDEIRRVNREIKILKKAHHRNVIQLFEVIDTQSSIYLVMENCDG